MLAIDEKAKKARGNDVLPLMVFLKKDIIDILNRNHKFCVGIDKMQAVWRNANRELNPIQQMEPESTQISQHQQKPEESDKPQEKLATKMTCIEFFLWDELDKLDKLD